jgi:hypothetical protein
MGADGSPDTGPPGPPYDSLFPPQIEIFDIISVIPDIIPENGFIPIYLS